jgi:WW domain
MPLTRSWSLTVVCILLIFPCQFGVHGLEIFPVTPTPSGWAYYNSDGKEVTGIASDSSDSSVVLAGLTYGSLTGSNAGAFDVFTIKLDSSGSEVWRYQTGTTENDYVYGVAVDLSDSSIVLCGGTFGSLSGSNAGSSDIFAIKLNSSGSEVWRYQNGTPVADSAVAVAIDQADSSIVLCGLTKGSVIGSNAGNVDVAIVKLDSSGSEIWLHQAGTASDDIATAIAVDPSDSSIVLCGYSYGSWIGSSAGSLDIFAIKLDASGSEVWRHQTGTASADYSGGVAIDQSDSSIVMTGYTRGAFTGSNAGDIDVFAIKMNSSGSEIWRYQTGTLEDDRLYSVAIDQSDSSIVSTGRTSGSLAGSNAGGYDIIAIKLDASGSEIWLYQTGTSAADFASDVAIDPSDSSVLLAGQIPDAVFGMKLSNSTILDTLTISSNVSEVSPGVWTANVLVNHTIYSPYISDVRICVLAIPQVADLHELQPEDTARSAYPASHQCMQYFVNTTRPSSYSGLVQLVALPTSWANTRYNVYAAPFFNGVPSQIRHFPLSFRTPPLDILPTVDAPDWNYAVADVTRVGRTEGRGIAFSNAESTIVMAGITNVAIAKPSAGDYDIYAIKLDSDGSEVWRYQTGTPANDYAYALAMDQSDSSVVLAGSTLGSLTGANAGSSYDMCAIKLDSSGCEIWRYQIGTYLNDFFTSVAVDQSDSSIVLAGTTPGSLIGSNAGGYDIVAIKLDSSGSEVWRYQIGTSAEDRASSVAIDPSDSSIVLTGYTYGSLIGSNAGRADMFAIKLNASGSEMWRYQTGTTEGEFPAGLAIDPSDSSVVLAGHTRGSLIGVNAGVYDVFAIKLESSGSEVWRYQTGTKKDDYTNSIAIDPSDSSIMLTGKTTISIGNSQFDAIHVVKLDFSGSKLWDFIPDYSNNNYINAVTMDLVGNAFLSGVSSVVIGDEKLYGASVLKISSNELISNSSIADVSAFDVWYSNVTISVTMRLYFSRASTYTVCAIAVPALDSRSVSVLNSSAINIIRSSDAMQLPPHSAYMCIPALDDTGDTVSNIQLEGLLVNTAYSVVVAHSLLNSTKVEHTLFFTRKAEAVFGSSLGLVSAPVISLAQPYLTLSLPTTVFGNPPNMSVTATSFGFRSFAPDSSATVTIPTNQGGSKRSTVVQLPDLKLIRDPLHTLSLGDHEVIVSVDVHGNGTKDTVFNVDTPSNYTAFVQIRGTLLVTQNGSDASLAVSAFGDTDSRVKLEIFPAPPTPVTVIFATLGGSPPLSYFVNASNSRMPDALFVAACDKSVTYQQWKLTENAYPAALIVRPILEGVNASLVTDVASEVSIHIRSAIMCRAIRRSTGMALTLLELYINEDSSYVTEILVECRSSLRFVTDSTRVFVSVRAPPSVQVSRDILEIKLGQESVAFSVSTSTTSVQQLSFDVSTESVQLDPSFFPLNPDGYTLSIQGVPGNIHNVTVPTATIDVVGNDWSRWQTVSISNPPLYSLVVQLVATNGSASLEFEPPNGTLLFTAYSATTLQFRCRAKVGVHVGTHHIAYEILGSDQPGYSILGSGSGVDSGTDVAVYGTISIDPPLRILYRTVPSTAFAIVLSGTPVDDTVIVELVASREMRDDDSSPLSLISIDPSLFVFDSNSALSLPITSMLAEKDRSNSPCNITVTAFTASSKWYVNQSWLVQIADISSLGVSFIGGLSHTLALTGPDANRTGAFVDSLILPSSATMQPAVIVFDVALSSTSSLDIAYGKTATNSWTICVSATITRNATMVYRDMPVYRVRCTVPGGVGANFSAAILFNERQAVLAVSNATFSYPAPTIWPGTLRNVESGLGDSRLFAPSVSASDTVYFEGTGFGLSADRINVTFGPASDPQLFKCVLITFTDTLLGCQLIGGRGINLVFRVDVAGQAVVGTDTYSYPNAPSITRIQGCDSGEEASSTLQQCPTLGSVVLTVWGTFFSGSKDAMQVQVGGDQCDIQSIALGGVALEDRLTCILPAGSGADRNLQISRVFADVTLTSSVTSTTARVSYAEPEILSISSPNCTSISATILEGCPRQVTAPAAGNDSAMLTDANSNLFRLVVTGRHFGNATIVVVIGSTLCRDPHIEVIDYSTDSQRITCQLPMAQETDQSVLILVPNGATNQGSPASVSFQQCPAGTFEDRVTQRCITCSRYEYQQSPGKPQCDACATNQYKSSPDPSQAFCALCPSGAICGQRLPVQNQVGYWLSPQLAGDVLSYKCLQGRCIAASTCFPSTSSMTSTRFASVSCCSEGRLLAQSNPLCGMCTAGYSEWNGTCIPCDSTNSGLVFGYVLLGYVILFGVYHITSFTSGAQLKVLVLFGQTIHAFVASDPTFPSIFGAVASLDPVGSSSSCVTPITGLGQASLPMIQLMILYLLLLSLVLVNMIAWCIHRYMCFHPGIGSMVFPKFKLSAFRRVAIALITMSFIPIFKATVLLGKCIEVASPTGDKLNLLEQYPSVDCTSSSYKIVYALSVIASVAIAILVSAFVVLYGQRRYRMYADLSNAQSKAVDAAADRESSSSAMQSGSDHATFPHRRISLYASDRETKTLKKFIEYQYGFLFQAFRATKWTASWQAVLMFRSVCLVLVSALVDDWRTRFVFLALLAVTFLAVHIHLLPYHYSTWDNQLETAALCVLSCIGMLNGMEWYSGDTIRALSIILYYGFLLSWLCVYVYQYWKAGKCHRWQDRPDNDRSDRSDVAEASSHVPIEDEPQGESDVEVKQPSKKIHKEAVPLVVVEWSWWQYLFCWYLAPRSRYYRLQEQLNGRAHDNITSQSSVAIMLRRMSSHRDPHHEASWVGTGTEPGSRDIALHRSSSEVEMEPSLSGQVATPHGGDGFDSERGSEAAAPLACANRQDSEDSRVNNLEPRPGASPDAVDVPLAADWTEYATDNGIPYFFNVITGETRWERPSRT